MEIWNYVVNKMWQNPRMRFYILLTTKWICDVTFRLLYTEWSTVQIQIMARNTQRDGVDIWHWRRRQQDNDPKHTSNLGQLFAHK